MKQRSAQDSRKQSFQRQRGGQVQPRPQPVSVATVPAAGVPAARIVDPRELASHPQFVARGFLEEVEHPVVGRQATMAAPFRYASVDRWLRRAAPLLGEHGAEILRELGHDPADIAALESEGVIGTRPVGV